MWTWHSASRWATRAQRAIACTANAGRGPHDGIQPIRWLLFCRASTTALANARLLFTSRTLSSSRTNRHHSLRRAHAVYSSLSAQSAGYIPPPDTIATARRERSGDPGSSLPRAGPPAPRRPRRASDRGQPERECCRACKHEERGAVDRLDREARDGRVPVLRAEVKGGGAMSAGPARGRRLEGAAPFAAEVLGRAARAARLTVCRSAESQW